LTTGLRFTCSARFGQRPDTFFRREELRRFFGADHLPQ
jgi:hypothetical protein